MTQLHPETQEKAGQFIAEVMALLDARLKQAIVRVANPRAGGDPMADIEVLFVVDELATRETFRIWELAGNASIKHEIIFSVQAYSTEDFKLRRNLPAISSFMSEGVEYDLH